MLKLEDKSKTKVDRDQYANNLRLEFSSKDSILPSGELNHVYFQTKLNQYWNQDDFNKLKKGLEEFGIGNWGKIIKKYFTSDTVKIIS